MMALALLPESAEIRPLWGPGETPEAQGVEGQLLQKELGRVWLHWADRTLTANGAQEAGDDRGYQPIALPTVATIQVRYGTPEPLKPRRYVLDDDQ